MVKAHFKPGIFAESALKKKIENTVIATVL